MFHYFKIPYITCTFFPNFIYNENIGPYFFSHIVSKKIPSAPPPARDCLEVIKEECRKGSGNKEDGGTFMSNTNSQRLEN